MRRPTIVRKRLTDITCDSANVRRHSERNIEAIKGSLKRFGQVTPIVIDADGLVRKGNGTVIAARELGWKTIQVICTGLIGGKATAYSIADNRSGDAEVGSVWDDAALAATLAALQRDDLVDHLATGFTDEEIDQVIADAQFDVADLVDGFAQGMNADGNTAQIAFVFEAKDATVVRTKIAEDGKAAVARRIVKLCGG